MKVCLSASKVVKVNLHTGHPQLNVIGCQYKPTNADPYLVPVYPPHVSRSWCPTDTAQTLPVKNVLAAINVGVDQNLEHQSEDVSGHSFLIGRICLLYLHSPSPLNCAIDLGLGHEGLASS